MPQNAGIDLTRARCEACGPDSAPVAAAQHARLLEQLPGWSVVTADGVEQLRKTFSTGNFVDALTLANRIGELAEAENHHPQLVVEWGRLTVSWWTHVIGGLHVNDFIMAARCEDIAG